MTPKQSYDERQELKRREDLARQEKATLHAESQLQDEKDIVAVVSGLAALFRGTARLDIWPGNHGGFSVRFEKDPQ